MFHLSNIEKYSESVSKRVHMNDSLTVVSATRLSSNLSVAKSTYIAESVVIKGSLSIGGLTQISSQTLPDNLQILRWLLSVVQQAVFGNRLSVSGNVY